MESYYATIGRRICNSPVVALVMRHENPISTLRDYGDVGEPEDTPEWLGKQFVKEFSELCLTHAGDKGAGLKCFAQRWTELDDPAGDLMEQLSEDLSKQVAAIKAEKWPKGEQ